MTDDQDARDQARRQYWQGRSRRSWRCPRCGRSYGEVDRVDVHHRDGNPHNNSPENLVALCKRCHIGGEHNREVDDDHLTPPSPGYLGPPRPRNLGPGP
ncbi:5-methylcytosine-specific restriction endonuclease McrA [Halarchaeum rubridurum]|uniref:5-methylcytosine-specific restriction endonuclease McrA n=1 Tax=Halarchaeum rubridurum TaxID=489911 RepID=A0A830FY11_9EURY|nr:HNH endonuclease signature motif containing protein [Halarchaeum rubridurum]MBP1953560.1 5-methylcytosine-specific restriction endonuclease McrA [Halarchaeum rubridurum]GGM64379.1 hypothetical protein GCM10009017_13010 [Halarchaeum rubridurum]